VIVNITVQSGCDFLVPVYFVISVKKNCSRDTKTESLILGTRRPKYRFACYTLSDNKCITNKGDTTLLSRV